MKKIHTLMALAVLAPMLIACAPKAEDVCQHIVDLTNKELGAKSDALSEESMTKFKETCVKESEKEKEKIGAIAYNKQAKCVMAVTTLAELKKCEDLDKKE